MLGTASISNAQVLIVGENGFEQSGPASSLVIFERDSTISTAATRGKTAAPTRRHGSTEILGLIQDAGLRYASHDAIRRAGITPRQWATLFRALIKIESGYNPRARSHVGAYGLGQLMPGTADYLGVDRHDPVQNLDGAVRYFLEMLDTFGTPELAIAAYNAGPGAVRRHGGIPPYRETQGHVRKVLAAFTELSQK